MSGYGGYYGPKYTSSYLRDVARMLEREIRMSGGRPEWRDLLKMAQQAEAIIRGREQARYEDWRD